jgi:hypothetical protein
MSAIAVYAAIVATGGLAWQVWTWWIRKRLRCEVRVGLWNVLVAQGSQPGVGVEVVNQSERPVRVTHVAFRKQGGSPDEWLVPTTMWRPFQLPFNMDAHDSGSVMYDRERCEQGGMDWTLPVVVAVWLSTGERFESEARPLADQAKGSLRSAA